jgi:hypothetical protein
VKETMERARVLAAMPSRTVAVTPLSNSPTDAIHTQAHPATYARSAPGCETAERPSPWDCRGQDPHHSAGSHTPPIAA